MEKDCCKEVMVVGLGRGVRQGGSGSHAPQSWDLYARVTAELSAMVLFSMTPGFAEQKFPHVSNEKNKP